MAMAMHRTRHKLSRLTELERLALNYDDECDAPTQSLYHVPPDWLLQPAGSSNLLVVFDELGATDLSLPSVSVRTLNP